MAWHCNVHLIVHGFIGYCRHQDIIAGAPLIINYIDFGVVNGVTGLFAWPTAKFPYPPALKPKRGGVLAWGLPMEGRGTDATLLVPHVPVKPVAAGPLLALTILLGSSRIIMGSNRTRYQCRGLGLSGEAEQPVGCCVFPHIPVSLNLQCWDFASKKLDQVSAPVMSDVVVAPNTVEVAVEFSDYLAAMIDWAIDVALAFLFAFGAKKGGKWWDARKAAKLEKSNRVAEGAYQKALKEGLTEEAAQAVREKVLAKETKSIVPKVITNTYDRIAAKPGGKQWLSALGGKIPYKLLVKNSAWYREDVQRPIDNSLPRW